MELNATQIESLRKISNGVWISREEAKSLCDLKLAEPGPVLGYVLTEAGKAALKSNQ
jgi:hypothetical protein